MALTARMVTTDGADPDGLAKLWTEAAGYEVRLLGSSSGAGLQLRLRRMPESEGSGAAVVEFRVSGAHW
jgi:hypothetical protein